MKTNALWPKAWEIGINICLILDCVINFFFKKGYALLNIKAMPLTFRPSTFSDKVLVCMPLAFKWQREGTAKEGRVCKYKVAPSSGPPPSSHCSSAFYWCMTAKCTIARISISRQLWQNAFAWASTTRILKSLVNLSKYALSFYRS
jgi:hypothetical protein